MQFNPLRFLLLSIPFLLSFSSLGQGQINLLNGKQIKADSIKSQGDKFVYFNPNKLNEKSVKRDNIFSINYPDGKEDFIFVPDTASGDINLDQMKFFIKGEQDARKYYHAPTATIEGIVIGAGSGYFAYYGIIVPALNAVGAGLHTPNIMKQHVSDTALARNQFYAYGYQSIARKRKVNNSLISGGISLTVSLFTLGFFNKQIDQFFYKMHPDVIDQVYFNINRFFYKLHHH